jgi:hypothetical protein
MHLIGCHINIFYNVFRNREKMWVSCRWSFLGLVSTCRWVTWLDVYEIKEWIYTLLRVIVSSIFYCILWKLSTKEGLTVDKHSHCPKWHFLISLEATNVFNSWSYVQGVVHGFHFPDSNWIQYCKGNSGEKVTAFEWRRWGGRRMEQEEHTTSIPKRVSLWDSCRSIFLKFD